MTINEVFENYDQAEVRDYMNNLRESGAMNMFSSASYLQDYFDMSHQEANAVVREYMKNKLED